MGPGQDAHLDRDRPDGRRVAAVDADVLRQDQLADGGLGQDVHEGGADAVAAPDVLEGLALLGAVVRLLAPSNLVGDVGADGVQPLDEVAGQADEQLGGGLRVGHRPMSGGMVLAEDEAHEVGELVAAGIGVQLVGQLERVIDRARLPVHVVREVTEHERQVEPDVVGNHRGGAHPLDELREHLGRGCARKRRPHRSGRGPGDR